MLVRPQLTGAGLVTLRKFSTAKMINYHFRVVSSAIYFLRCIVIVCFVYNISYIKLHLVIYLLKVILKSHNNGCTVT